MANNKTDNFLTAIKEDSISEKIKIEEEVASFKAEEIKKAEAKGKRDAEAYINKQNSKNQSAVTSKYSLKNFEAQGEVFHKRMEITAKVFEEAKNKLINYTSTPEYKAMLLDYAKEIAEKFNDNSCVIYVKNDDLKYADEIKDVFKGEATVEADNMIKIGGIIGNCKAMKLVADNTFDSKLEAQKQWFTENSQLKVL